MLSNMKSKRHILCHGHQFPFGNIILNNRRQCNTQEIFRRKLEQELSAKFKAKINKSIERERLWWCRFMLVELRPWYRVPIYICSVSGVPTRT